MSEAIADFGGLLRHLRLKAHLSQEQLARRAGVGVDAISRNERGLRWAPRPDTIALLAGALQLSGKAKAAFEDAANRKRGSAPPSESRRHNLPWQATSFVGREDDVAAVSGLLAPRRLVTITGAGGIGKTRVALEIASRFERVPTDGVWFVDLAPIDDGSHVPTKLASALDLQLPEETDVLAAVVSAIKDCEMLLLLDNCEHVIPAALAVAKAIIDACPRVSLLATSRERLSIAGETAYPLGTLAIPTAEVTTATEGRSYAALELFVERATTAKYDFVFSDEHVEAAVDICRRLDGIALAIELAAARLPVLGLTALRAQLSRHFHVIADGRHDLPVRQRTLNETISWSHALLSEPERTLFRRLSVFAGGWTLEAAEAVCADEGLPASAIPNTLLSLAEKSLVCVDIDATATRYSFFASTLAFARDRLDVERELPALSRRHAEWMAVVSDCAHDMYIAGPRWRWDMEVKLELGNALAALDWSLDSKGDAALAARIASGLLGLWGSVGLAMYGRRYVYAALERIDAREHPALKARLFLAQHRYLHSAGRVDAMQHAIALLENGANNAGLLAMAHLYLGYALMMRADYDDAKRSIDRASDLLHSVGLQRSSLYSTLLRGRSESLLLQGFPLDAKAVLNEALSLASALNDDWLISQCQSVLAEIEFSAGDAREAVRLGKEAVANAGRVRSSYQPSALNNLGCYHLALGEIDAAEANIRAALQLARTSHVNEFAAHLSVLHLAAIAAHRGQPSRAARLLGYADGWHERTGVTCDPTDQKSRDMALSLLRKQISDDDISSFAAQGAQLTEDVAMDEALRT